MQVIRVIVDRIGPGFGVLKGDGIAGLEGHAIHTSDRLPGTIGAIVCGGEAIAGVAPFVEIHVIGMAGGGVDWLCGNVFVQWDEHGQDNKQNQDMGETLCVHETVFPLVADVNALNTYSPTSIPPSSVIIKWNRQYTTASTLTRFVLIALLSRATSPCCSCNGAYLHPFIVSKRAVGSLFSLLLVYSSFICKNTCP